MEDRFFVIYPKSRYDETNKIMQDIADRLVIDYQLWKYSDVNDEYDYYQNVIEPTIEKAEFVLVFLSKGAEEEYLVTETVRLCSNMNKNMIPIKLKNSDVKDKDWNFRAKLLDYYDEEQRIRIIEQMHGWLGLVSRGDIYGSKVFILTDNKSVITRDNEVLGRANTNGQFACILAQGSRKVDVKSDDGCWNRYKYSVPDNDSEVHFEASLSGVHELSKQPLYTFDPDSDTIPRWDATDRTDFVLVASSEDEKKKNIIYDSFDKSYRSKMKPYPEFHPKEIKHSKVALIVFWGIALTLISIGFFLINDWTDKVSIIVTGHVVIILFFIIRAIKDRAIRRGNERRRRELIDNTDKYNYSVWANANKRMNSELALQGLEPITLRQQPAPTNENEAETVDEMFNQAMQSVGNGNANIGIVETGRSTSMQLTDNGNQGRKVIAPKSILAIVMGGISLLVSMYSILFIVFSFIFSGIAYDSYDTYDSYYGSYYDLLNFYAVLGIGAAIIAVILSVIVLINVRMGFKKYYESPEKYKGVGLLKGGRIMAIISIIIIAICVICMQII